MWAEVMCVVFAQSQRSFCHLALAGLIRPGNGWGVSQPRSLTEDDIQGTLSAGPGEMQQRR